jgi:excisionase family DNA binding protein
MSETNTTSPYMTTEELADHARTTKATVRGWRHRGTGPKGTRVGKRVLYRREAVEAWLKARENADVIGQRATA